MINNPDLGILSKNGVGLFILIARRISHFGSKVRIYNLFFGKQNESLRKREKEHNTKTHTQSLDWNPGDKILYRS